MIGVDEKVLEFLHLFLSHPSSIKWKSGATTLNQMTLSQKTLSTTPGVNFTNIL
jgi:hypothetical protein